MLRTHDKSFKSIGEFFYYDSEYKDFSKKYFWLSTFFLKSVVSYYKIGESILIFRCSKYESTKHGKLRKLRTIYWSS